MVVQRGQVKTQQCILLALFFFSGKEHAELCRWRSTCRNTFSFFFVHIIIILDVADISKVYFEVQC